MKKIFLYIILILFISCNKSEEIEEVEEIEEEVINYGYRDFIVAGQDTGIGIRYIDIEPDIVLFILGSDLTIESIDLDNDSISDIEIQIDRSPESLLSWSDKILSIVPLDSNFICVMQDDEKNAKPFNTNDTINLNENWSNSSALLYRYRYDCCPGREKIYGYWNYGSDVYVGVKKSKGEHLLYGWIDINFVNSFKVVLRQFAVTVPFPTDEK